MHAVGYISAQVKRENAPQRSLCGLESIVATRGGGGGGGEKRWHTLISGLASKLLSVSSQHCIDHVACIATA